MKRFINFETGTTIISEPISRLNTVKYFFQREKHKILDAFKFTKEGVKNLIYFAAPVIGCDSWDCDKSILRLMYYQIKKSYIDYLKWDVDDEELPYMRRSLFLIKRLLQDSYYKKSCKHIVYIAQKHKHGTMLRECLRCGNGFVCLYPEPGYYVLKGNKLVKDSYNKEDVNKRIAILKAKVKEPEITGLKDLNELLEILKSHLFKWWG